MKILRVLPSMDFGGIERGVYDFSSVATISGHKVVIVSGPGRFIPPLIEKGIRWYNLPMDKKTPAVFFRSIHQLKEIIKEEKPEIVHIQSRFPCWIAYYIKGDFSSTPFVTSIHNFYNFRWYSKATGKGDLVITVSNALKKYAIDYLNVPEDKIRVVYNGVEEDFAEIEKGHSSVIRIGMIARFTMWKGHFCFLEALRKLHKGGYKIEGLIVGTGSNRYRGKLEEWVIKNGMRDIVNIQQMDAKEALKNIDILVVPSVKPEGFGRTVVEAQMSKTPVIGTDIGALPELIKNGETGFLVNPGDSDSIADYIEKLMKDKVLYQKISNQAQKIAIEKFSLKNMVENTLNVYSELLDRKY